MESVLIAMCAYCTKDNGKLDYLRQTLDSLLTTVDLKKHELIIIQNDQNEETSKLIDKYLDFDLNIKLIYPGENLGTARGINLAMKQRKKYQFFVKCDDDWTTNCIGWVDNMLGQIKTHPQIGILGLKRDDVYGELIEDIDGDLLWNDDIMGTCTMYNPNMIAKIGGLVQFSNYGFDDSIYSLRSLASGFKNAFMKNIKIVNLDEGGTEYTEWKKQEAQLYIHEANIYMNKIKKGEISYYYGGE